jgi:hypothetical protein
MVLRNLFRGIREDNGGWAMGDLVHLNGYCYIHVGGGLGHKVAPDSVCQWTGLWDTHNKRVFVGDTISCSMRTGLSRYLCTVEKDGCEYIVKSRVNTEESSYHFTRSLSHCCDIIVEGNIFDGKEMKEDSK